MNSNLNRLTLPRQSSTIRLGQVWRTVNGEIARVICVDRDHPTHPVVALAGSDETPITLTKQGKLGTSPNAMDFASLWRDPAVIEGWVNFYQNGSGTFHRTKDEANSWSSPNLVTSMKVTGIEEVKSYRRRRGSKMANKKVDVKPARDSSPQPVSRSIVDTARKTTRTIRDIPTQ